MPKFKYIVRLKSAHDEKGLTPYMVNKLTGVATATVDKYAKEKEVEVDQLNVAIAALCHFYGVKFHEAVEVVAIEEEEDPETESPLLATA